MGIDEAYVVLVQVADPDRNYRVTAVSILPFATRAGAEAALKILSAHEAVTASLIVDREDSDDGSGDDDPGQ